MSRPPQRGMNRAQLELGIYVHWKKLAAPSAVTALAEADSDDLVNQAGRVLFVVIGALHAAKHIVMDEAREEAAQRMVDAMLALHDQAGEPDVPAERRARIVLGLQDCMDLIPQLREADLKRSAFELACKLERGDVRFDDFARKLR